jgi:hypothetical protein
MSATILCFIISTEQDVYQTAAKEVWRSFMNLHPQVQCLFLEMNNNLSVDCEVKGDTLTVRGYDSINPGILTKRVRAFKMFLDHSNADFCLQTNLSSIWNWKGLFSKISELGLTRNSNFVLGANVFGLFPSGCGALYPRSVAESLVATVDVNSHYWKNDDEVIGEVLRDLHIPFDGHFDDSTKLITSCYHIRCKNVASSHDPSVRLREEIPFMKRMVNLFYPENVKRNHFAICVATFQRKNGRSPEYLKRALESVMSGTYSNWTLYLVGDRYEDNEEWLKLVKLVPEDKIRSVNLPFAQERDNREKINALDLWKVGGVNAMNTARQMAVKDGVEWICHLDDDDVWNPRRLELLNLFVNEFPESSFFYNYSTFVNSVLPKEKVSVVEYDNLFPEARNCIHSSYVFHRSLLENFKMKTYPEKTDECGDMQFLRYLKENRKDKKVVFIPEMLTHHFTEGETLN